MIFLLMIAKSAESVLQFFVKKKNTHDSNQILQVIFKITSRITRQCGHQQLNYFYFLFLPLAGVNITAKARSIL